MCGIAGFYGFRDDNLIKTISCELTHRGPDGEGFYIDDQVTLLNRRLAIIDRKGGDQPIYNEDKTIVVSYNGEIYNYRELTEDLRKSGHKFRTKSDTEVIVHAYEEWAEKCFDKFNGMFAIAIYDKKKKKLILARDHFGIKPLYYAVKNRATQESPLQIIFSSEIKPILNTGLIRREPNDRIIYRYLRYRVHDDNEETFFEGIYRLLPGQILIIQNSEFRVQSYSNLEQELLENKDLRKLENVDITKFKKELIKAIRYRLISEVPVGTCLSGGLDSSTVVSIVNKLLQEKAQEAESVGKVQNTFSAVFPGLSNDEGKYIDEVVQTVGTGQCPIHTDKVVPQSEEFFKEIEEFIRTQEEPTISTGPYAQYKVMQLARGKVTVLLDGQGSDEMMAGYLPYYFVYLRQLLKEKKYFRFIREVSWSLDVIWRYFIAKKSVDPVKVLKDNFVEKFASEKFLATNDNLKKRLVEDIFKNSLQSLLRYEDKNAMHFSLEGRVPFLDFNLLRYLFRLNDSAIIRNGWNKYILRRAVTDLLPETIVKRRNKIGFTTPEYEWFMRMENKTYGIFLSESFAKRKYFKQQVVLKLFEEFIQGKNEDTMLFWRVLNLELWLREFIDAKTNKNYNGYKNYKKFRPNQGKKLEIRVEGKTYLRYPLKTELFNKGDNIANKAQQHIFQCFKTLKSNPDYKDIANKKWFVVITEKIVAISQGRSYFIWDIKPSILAKILSRYVKKTPYGIGLGSPWTMQLAIGEIGVIRVIGAAIIGALAKFIGVPGLFYRIAGDTVRSIDGPTEYSLYPSNVSAKLGPKEPQKVSEEIHSVINSKFKILNSKQIPNSKLKIPNFLGVAIIDANDLGQKVLANSTNLPNKLIEKIFSDNPMGQASEQTPLVIVFAK